MPAVITVAPIAAKLARLIPLHELVPRDAVEDFLRENRKQASKAGEAMLPRDIEPFFGHYCVVTRAAAQLLGAPAFERLGRFHDDIEDQYMPGGPPMSPIYDSFAMQFVLGSVPQGIGSETPYSVLARLLLADGSLGRLQRLAQSMADAGLGIYRVKSACGHHAEIEPVRGGDALAVRLTGPFLRSGDFGLMRVLRFDDDLFVADSPYLLLASETEWRDHLARVVASKQGAAAAAPEKKASKLTKKEQARRRQKERAKAERNDPEGILKRYLKFGTSDRYWFDYVMDAYAGERRGIVFLAGVPDRPELLPHSPNYAGGTEPDLPPMAELREALMRVAQRERLLELAHRDLARLRAPDGADAGDLPPNEQHLLSAYATLGLRSEGGTTALERFERSHDAQSLRSGVRDVLESIERGWFSVFRIDRIHMDQGLEVFDVLRAEKLEISERSGTRQVGLGDLMIGWVCKDEVGTLTLEGGISHVPSLVAGAILSLVADLGRALPPLADESAWKRRAPELVLPIIAGILELKENPPLPRLANTSGDPLEIVTGHYRIRDRDRVLAVLRSEFQDDGGGSYSWVGETDVSLARIELSRTVLRVHVNSRKRLRSVQQRLERLLGDAIERSLEAHEDVEKAVRTRREGRKAGTGARQLELSPELTSAFQEIVINKIRETLDEPIPQFRNKTLRQLARSKQSRPDAVSWLREQERLLKSNPQLAGLDMRPLWQELRLPYQGLDTDPPI